MKPILAMLGKVMLSVALAAGSAIPAAAQQRGGMLNAVVNPEPPTLMLGLNQFSGVQIIGARVYQGLLTYDDQYGCGSHSAIS